jgi:Rieske Fe-S protein
VRHFLDAEAPVAIDAEEPTRRDFIILAANAFVAVGGAVALWPFIDQMNPDAGALARQAGLYPSPHARGNRFRQGRRPRRAAR